MATTPKSEQQRSDFSDRLQIALKNIGVRTLPAMKSTLTSWYGVSIESARKWLIGLAMPQPERVFDIAKRCGVRSDWLTTGSGPMSLTDVEHIMTPLDANHVGPMWSQLRDSDEGHGFTPPLQRASQNRKTSSKEPQDEVSYMLIPEHSSELASGRAGPVTPDYIEANAIGFRASSLIRRRLQPDNLRQAIVRGDSMKPYLCSGDTALIDTSIKHILEGEIFGIIAPNGEIRFRRLFRMLDGRVRVSCDNPDKTTHPDEIVASEDSLKIAGRFAWLGRFSDQL